MKSRAALLVVLIASLSSCSGGGARSAAAGADIPMAQNAANSSAFPYHIVYLPVDTGCNPGSMYLAKSDAVVAVLETCGLRRTDVWYVWAHGHRTMLPQSTYYVYGENARDQVSIKERDNVIGIYNYVTRSETVLKGVPEDIPGQINDSGYVEGTKFTCGPRCPEIALWSPDGNYRLVSSLPVTATNRGLGINASGTVIASSITGGGPTELDHAYIFEHDGPTVSIDHMIGQRIVDPNDVNDKNDVTINVGQWPNSKGYLFIGTSKPIAIPPLRSGEYTSVSSVNDNDQVVGWSCNLTGQCSGFLWTRTSPTSGYNRPLQDLVPGNLRILPYTVNNKGEILAFIGDSDLPALIVPNAIVNP